LALGQNLVGLPEYGVALGGAVTDPVIVNYSARTIIGHVLRLSYGDGTGVNFANFKARGIWMHRSGNESAEGLRPNQSETPLTRFTTHPTVRMQVRGNDFTGKLPSHVVLDSVVFADGQMVGPDVIQTFAKLSARIAALREFATQAAVARLNPAMRDAFWAEVVRLCGQGLTYNDHWKSELALDFRWAHSRNADSEAFDMADRVLTLPTPWRAR
jgi:hypothetical protein